MESDKLDSLIDDLKDTVNTIVPFQTKWKPVWGLIRDIGASFKDIRYPNRQARKDAWARFQSLVQKVKECQANEQVQYEDRARKSEQHKYEILHCADMASPSSDFIVHLATGGLSLIAKAAIDLLPGPPVDDEKNELQRCSKALKKGWDLLSLYKDEMLGRDKHEAFKALQSAQQHLQERWDEWKQNRNAAYEKRRGAAKERAEKHSAWMERVEANIDNLKQRLERLTSVLAHKESHLDELRDKRDSAWNDDFRDRVEGWISEEEDNIRDIQDKIEQVEGWLEEARSKLR